jgi:glycosyltransferase involved in cell wall biosynthesis
MHCGAAVIAGNNSSQIEVVGKAGLLINVNDPADLADKLVQILENPEFAQTLQQRALVQARTFSWDRTAGLAMTAIDGLGQRQPVRRNLVRRHRVAKRRIAFFSPFPPKYSGISDYSARLLQELKHTYEIDLYHEPGYVPQPALQCTEFMCGDARFFARYAAVKDYRAVLYQMGNSAYHDFMYDTMLRYRGIVTLHDFNLAGYQFYRSSKMATGPEYIREELLHWYPEQTKEILATLKSLPWNYDDVVAEFGRRGWFLNGRIVDAANRLIVHSPWCLEQARAASPADAERVVVIPQGAAAREISFEERGQIRARFGLSRDGLVFASFGFLSPEKMICEALDAFQAVASANESAVFFIAGKEVDSGDARRHAAELGLIHRVRFLGRQIDKDFVDLVAATDVGVNLRRPPTNGETSAALLNLLGSGVATMVTDVATFSDYPDATVCKVRWESEGPAGLKRAMLGLASDRKKRETIGHAAREHVRNRHDWSKVAELYVEVIENCHAEQAGASSRGRNGSGPMPRMHAVAQEVGA